MAVAAPRRTEDGPGRARQRDEAVFGALAPVHVDHHPWAVDVGDLQILRFLQAQATRVDRAQEGVVTGRPHAPQDGPHLRAAQDRRPARLALGAPDVQEMPVPLQHVPEEEPNAAGADAHRVRRPVVDVAPPQDVRSSSGSVISSGGVLEKRLNIRTARV